MNASTLAFRPGVVMDVVQQRVDEHSRNVVDQGVRVQASLNTVCALEYLKSHNVDPGVIERVLSGPQARRRCAP